MHISRLLRKVILGIGIPVFAPFCFAQGTFGNLDFESGTVPSVPPNQPVFINAVDGVPGWTVYVGPNQTSQVWYNGISLGGALVSLVDRHTATYGNNVIGGNFTATLDAGIASVRGVQMAVSAALAQTGFIPMNAHSLVFGASMDVSALLLTFDGQNLPFVRVANLPNHQVYAADISRIAGLTGELRFTELPLTPPTFPIVYLDSIAFSPALIPEPSCLALTALGALAFGLSRARHRPRAQ